MGDREPEVVGFEEPGVRGFLHLPPEPCGDALVLAHGAGSDCRAPLLAAAAAAFAAAGVAVLRCDLAFRQARPHGPPFPAAAARDREGLRVALAALGRAFPGSRLFLGGHSYGGRQATMLAAEESGAAAGLLLLSYPLHPPNQPGKLRTEHFPQLRTPAVFVHGAIDPFGTPDEMRQALALIPAATHLEVLERMGHDLNRGKCGAAAAAVAAFRASFPPTPSR